MVSSHMQSAKLSIDLLNLFQGSYSRAPRISSDQHLEMYQTSNTSDSLLKTKTPAHENIKRENMRPNPSISYCRLPKHREDPTKNRILPREEEGMRRKQYQWQSEDK